MSETKWIQGKLVKQVYKGAANNFQLARKDGSTFGLIYKGSPLSKYEKGTEVYATDASLYIDGDVKVYKTEDPPKFKYKEDTTTYVDKSGEVQTAPKVREITTEELTLAGVELLLVNALDKEVEEIRVLMQELAISRLF
tara:strand:+ start:1111 stop:1527 length:417 start_codon:yes stop_codon:yes gene_type:complete